MCFGLMLFCVLMSGGDFVERAVRLHTASWSLQARSRFSSDSAAYEEDDSEAYVAECRVRIVRDEAARTG